MWKGKRGCRIIPQGDASAPRYGGTISSLFASHYGASSYRSDYGYDNLGRLVSEIKKTGTSGTIPFSEDHFAYDTNGNLTLATRLSGTEIEAKTESYSRIGNRIDRLLIADEDPDGRDGIMTGSGTEDDPYVVTANYYYQKESLNSDTIFGLNSAIETNNNHGKTRMNLTGL